jgi:hypothetical protein
MDADFKGLGSAAAFELGFAPDFAGDFVLGLAAASFLVMAGLAAGLCGVGDLPPLAAGFGPDLWAALAEGLAAGLAAGLAGAFLAGAAFDGLAAGRDLAAPEDLPGGFPAALGLSPASGEPGRVACNLLTSCS